MRGEDPLDMGMWVDPRAAEGSEHEDPVMPGQEGEPQRRSTPPPQRKELHPNQSVPPREGQLHYVGHHEEEDEEESDHYEEELEYQLRSHYSHVGMTIKVPKGVEENSPVVHDINLLSSLRVSPTLVRHQLFLLLFWLPLLEWQIKRTKAPSWKTLRPQWTRPR